MSARDLLRDYLDRLDRLEKIEFVQMAEGWDALFAPIIADAPQTDRAVLERRLFEASIAYAQLNNTLISNHQALFVQQGLSSAQDMLDLGGRSYDHLSFGQTGLQVGFTSDGSPLNSHMLQRYTENAALGLGLLLAGFGVAALTEALMKNLSKSFQIARTEQMFMFREAQVGQFGATGFVRMKNWVGEPSACGRICIPAISRNPYPLNAPMLSHPNCRCGWEPVLVPIRETI